MGIPGFGSPYIAFQQPFGTYAPTQGVPSPGRINQTGFPSISPSIQAPRDMFSPTSSALDFSGMPSPTSFNTLPVMNTANPFQTAFSGSNTGLKTSRGLIEGDEATDGTGTTTGTEDTLSTTDDTTTTGETEIESKDDTAETTGDETEEGEDGEKKNKMTMGQYLNLILYCRRPDGSIDWGAFAAKYQTDEKPVKVTPLEPQVFGNYDEG